MQIRWRFAVGYFCRKNEHISMFPTGPQLIANKLVSSSTQIPRHDLMSIYTLHRKTAKRIFLKTAS